MIQELIAQIEKAGTEGKLLESAVANLKEWLGAGFLPEWATKSIERLVRQGAYSELNDRFYRYMEFGTGGLRGRTIGAVTTEEETGKASDVGTPEHPGIGSNLLNEFNIIRATVGLFNYTRDYLKKEARFDAPKLVIAHDQQGHPAMLPHAITHGLGQRELKHICT